MPVTGIDSVNKEIGMLVGRLSGELTRKTITEVLITGQNYAVLLTPVDTSNLINSRFTQIINNADGTFTGRVGYTAAYADYVHKGLSKTGQPLNFQKPGSEAEFLRKGFERDGADEIKQIIKRNYSV